MKMLLQVLFTLAYMFCLSITVKAEPLIHVPYLIKHAFHIYHKNTVSEYLKFEVAVKQLMVQSNALPKGLDAVYLKTGLKEMQKDPNFGKFLFVVHEIGDEMTGDISSLSIDIYYGSYNIKEAFRIRNIAMDKYGEFNWIEEIPENKKIPK